VMAASPWYESGPFDHSRLRSSSCGAAGLALLQSTKLWKPSEARKVKEERACRNHIRFDPILSSGLVIPMLRKRSPASAAARIWMRA